LPHFLTENGSRPIKPKGVHTAEITFRRDDRGPARSLPVIAAELGSLSRTCFAARTPKIGPMTVQSTPGPSTRSVSPVDASRVVGLINDKLTEAAKLTRKPAP
jgi:hypothetical protein